jgi:hypothetical protein
MGNRDEPLVKEVMFGTNKLIAYARLTARARLKAK